VSQIIEENEKDLPKVYKVTYDEFESSLERDIGKRPQFLHKFIT